MAVIWIEHSIENDILHWGCRTKYTNFADSHGSFQRGNIPYEESRLKDNKYPEDVTEGTSIKSYYAGQQEITGSVSWTFLYPDNLSTWIILRIQFCRCKMTQKENCLFHFIRGTYFLSSPIIKFTLFLFFFFFSFSFFILFLFLLFPSVLIYSLFFLKCLSFFQPIVSIFITFYFLFLFCLFILFSYFSLIFFLLYFNLLFISLSLFFPFCFIHFCFRAFLFLLLTFFIYLIRFSSIFLHSYMLLFHPSFLLFIRFSLIRFS